MAHIISSVNVNGVRAAARKGLLEWLAATEADAVCLQETRATDDELQIALGPALASGWHLATAEPTAAKGRSGVAILSRRPADKVRVAFGSDEFAESGRYVEADFGDLTVASVYVPSGGVGTPRQDEKDRFLDAFGRYLRAAALATTEANKNLVVSGDWNIAHTDLDLKAWKANRKSSGCLPYERVWIDSLLAAGLADVARRLNPEVAGPYTWWSYRGRAFDNDAGWRIDYQLATAELAERAKQVTVERAQTYDTRWSDHAPVTVQYR
ncbi:exodeoxyribonuclease III [Antrihabitans sp. YC3-6]|uniref:Exodeoxyribonuclease III n=1 Tax=Antrihabitans stalagmiti TaxID=2799499 RepID=A0A934NNP2_9NOCA|nr:exodeoxyribonuclease III [Antrihabitans stalagmiti]MBJ8338495.1 exodeoxyribonuclease III [Antrihabitans stalagmiti]